MEGSSMEAGDVFSLGLGLSAPWKLASQRLDLEKRPHELRLELVADRGALFPCPQCQRACKAHDFESFTWQHLNFFQHHCFITARVPRVDCPDHGVKRAAVPWARPGSRFTLLFEQAALVLVREMPVLAASRFIGITDKRLWRIVDHYVRHAIAGLDLRGVRSIGLDETASKRRHNYVTVFIDMDRRDKPVIFVTPGKGKACVADFRAFMLAHGGEPDLVAEVVCDMSPAFLAAATENFPNAALTVDWFHVVQLFTTAVDQVRKAEARQRNFPKAARWAVLKAGDRTLTNDQCRLGLEDACNLRD
jgi:transposase